MYIVDLTQNLAVHATNLLTQLTVVEPLNSENWNWKPVPLGYVNTGPQAVYVFRRPIRKWKQGLHRDNMGVGNRADLAPIRLRHADILRSRELGRCIQRDYPSFEDASKAVMEGDARGKVASRSFHPEFSLERNELGLLWLAYRGTRVGWYEKGHLRLGEGMQHLIQLYEEVVA
jgi:hypothetical protein